MYEMWWAVEMATAQRTRPRSVSTKICNTSQRQRGAAYYNFYIFFTIIAGELFLCVQEWLVMMQL